MQGPIARQDGLDGMTVIAAVLLIAALVMIGPDGRSRMLEKVWAYIPGGASEQQPATIDVPPVVVDEPAPAVADEPPAVRIEQQPAPEQAVPAVTLQADTGDLDVALEVAQTRANETGETVNVTDGNATYTITPDPQPGRYEAAPEEPPVLNATAGGRAEPLPEPPIQRAAPPPAPEPPRQEPWQQDYNRAIQSVVPGFELIPEPAPQPPANPAPVLEAVQGATRGDYSAWTPGMGNLGLEGAVPAECGVNVSCASP